MRKITLTMAGALSMISIPSTADAQLTGQAVTAEYRFPTVTTPYPPVTYAPQSFVVGMGQESTIVIEGVTTFNIDFSDAMLDLTFDTSLTNPTWNSAPFNGLVFTSAAFSGLSGVTVAPTTNFVGFDASRVSIVGNELRLDWNGLSYDSDTQIGLTFAATAVPEPAAWALMTLGIGFLGMRMRRRGSAARQRVGIA